jgi:prepilin-type N-terminal cleavage/methylation domain-containing protein
MFSPSINGRIDLSTQRVRARPRDHRPSQRERSWAPFLNYLSRRSCAKSDQPLTKNSKRCGAVFILEKQRERKRAFTLLELLIVVAIIGLLLVLMAPAFTYIKGGTDVTSVAYTIKGVLDTARTYAKTNNTYTWIGFYEEDVSQPSVIPAPDPLCPGCVGRLVMSIVASKDGTYIYDPDATGTENFIDPTRLTQVGKLIKIDNIHLPLFELGTGSGDTFDARPSPTPRTDAPLSRFGELNSSPTAPTTNTKFPFQYPVGDPAPARQYRFRRTLRFSPTGECRINSTYDVRTIVEVGLLQTHGSVTPPPRSGGGTSFVTWDGNVAAVQITGFGGNVKIYRR